MNYPKKLKKKESFQTHCMWPALSWYQSQTRTLQKENYRQISLINIDVKIFKLMVARQIQHYIRRIIYNDQVGSILGMQGWFNIHKPIHYPNKIKSENHLITSMTAENAFNKIKCTLIIKTLNKEATERKYLNIIKFIYEKPTTNIILKGESWKLSLWDLKQEKDTCSSTFIQHGIGSLNHSN